MQPDCVCALCHDTVPIWKSVMVRVAGKRVERVCLECAKELEDEPAEVKP